MSRHARVQVSPGVSQTWRIVRLAVVASAAAGVFTPLIHAAVLRWPVIGLAIGVTEAVYRIARPKVDAPPVVTKPSTRPPTPTP